MKLNTCLFFIFFTSFIFANKSNLRIYTETIDEEIYLYTDSYEFCDFSLKIDFKVKNLKIDTKKSVYFIAKPQEKKQLILKIPVIDKKKGYSFSYEVNMVRGNYKIEDVDENYVYDLPFDRVNKIGQGYNGKETHKGLNALDFTVAVGTKIHAAREGVVVALMEDYNRTCYNSSCEEFSNYVLLAHKDGTFAMYGHLKLNGVVVSIGDKVTKGQLIAYSGNTGYSSGPHLHFEVFLDSFYGHQTLRTKFRVGKGKKVKYLRDKGRYVKRY